MKALEAALKHGEATLVAPRDQMADLRKKMDSLGILPFVKQEIAHAES